MDQPLGPYVGNALEIQQAVRVLHGQTEGFERFIDISIELAAHLLVHGGLYTMDQRPETRQALRSALATGNAFHKFRDMVAAQGGDVGMIDNPTLLPKASEVIDVTATQAGYVTQIDATAIGWASVALGAGRMKVTDLIDHAVGIEALRFVGDPVVVGEQLARLHVNREDRLDKARSLLLGAYKIGPERVEPRPLILETLC